MQVVIVYLVGKLRNDMIFLVWVTSSLALIGKTESGFHCRHFIIDHLLLNQIVTRIPIY